MGQMTAEVERIAASLSGELADLDALLSGETILTEDDEEYAGDLLDYLADHALEIYGNARIGLLADEPDLREIVVVFGTGGPHRELVIDWRGNAEGKAYWGGESATKWLGQTDLFDYLAEYVAPGGYS